MDQVDSRQIRWKPGLGNVPSLAKTRSRRCNQVGGAWPEAGPFKSRTTCNLGGLRSRAKKIRPSDGAACIPILGSSGVPQNAWPALRTVRMIISLTSTSAGWSIA
jgi:hypothetical protein